MNGTEITEITHRGAHFAFTNRWGGVSAVPYDGLNLAFGVGDDAGAVRANRASAAAALGLDPAQVVWMSQVHGRDVAVVGAPGSPIPEATPPRVDALVTAGCNLALAVQVADCVPVLLADPAAAVVAAVHAGRKGLVAGVVPAAVEVMCAQGATPERIVAATGPSVCGGCYEVPDAMRAQVAERVPESWSTTRHGTSAVDVAAGVHAQLARLGIRQRERSDICTVESMDHFSYRREGQTGRFAGYVWLDGCAIPGAANFRGTTPRTPGPRTDTPSRGEPE